MMSENGCTDDTLTEEEISAIRESWALVWKDKKENAIKIFVTLFSQYPEAKEKFKDFQELSIDEIKEHKKLRAHALSVVYALKSFIDNLDDLETLEQLVRKIARSHYERTVTQTQIEWVSTVFVKVLEDLMKSDMKNIHRNAWVKLFDIVQDLWKQEHNGIENNQTTT